MNSLISIVGVILSGKENYQEWFRKVKNTLIFNDMWDGICENENLEDKKDEETINEVDKSAPVPPTNAKELALWKSKDKKAYALIIASVSEEVSRHLVSSKSAWEALKKLKDLYDSHSELEIIQLLMKLFNLELKDNDPMKLASEIRAIFHDIDATGVKVDIQLTAFIKALYPTYTHYLESLQASGQMKAREKQCYRCGKTGHTASYCRTSWDKIVNKKEQVQDKGNDKGNPPESTHYVVAHCNLGFEEAFSTSFSWNDIWLLDTGDTCHMTFRKYFFETFSDQIDAEVHLVDKSQLKPSGIGFVRLKLSGLADYILSNVLYVPQLKKKCNFSCAN